ncbi:MAG: polysaccharide deacetylase family protein [Spirochaetaceae bacterium]|nr:MAG: polysaccharide deacetylase family protein [Spirochaetaceae bacterium]
MRYVRIHYRLFVVAALALAGCRSVPLPDVAVEPPRDPVVPVVSAQILRWRDGSRAAASLTFDDSTLDHYLLAAPELDRRGLHGTFFVITGVMQHGVWDDFGTRRLQFSWNQARRLAARGHEIGSHSHTHPDVSALPFARAELQLLKSLQRLQREIPRQHGITFAWPYWRSTETTRALASRYYIASRAGQATTPRYRAVGPVGARPEDMQRVNALGTRPVETLDVWQEALHEILDDGGWAVLSLHGIDDGVIPREAIGWQPLSLETYRDLLDVLVSQDFWVAPFGEVVKYLERRDTTHLHVYADDDQRVIIDVHSPLDPQIYNVPLSVRLTLPPTWHDVEISADGQPLAWHATSAAVVIELPAEASKLSVIPSATPGASIAAHSR